MPQLPTIPFPAGLFIVQITQVMNPTQYQFVEWWHTQGSWQAKSGGRFGNANNPGYALPGVTFNVLDFALCRLSEGEGGLFWELIPIPAAGNQAVTDLTVSSIENPQVTYPNITNLRFDTTNGPFSLVNPDVPGTVDVHASFALFAQQTVASVGYFNQPLGGNSFAPTTLGGSSSNFSAPGTGTFLFWVQANVGFLYANTTGRTTFFSASMRLFNYTQGKPLGSNDIAGNPTAGSFIVAIPSMPTGMLNMSLSYQINSIHFDGVNANDVIGIQGAMPANGADFSTVGNGPAFTSASIMMLGTGG